MTRDYIFGASSQYHSLASMVMSLGAPPKAFLKRCRKAEAFFDEHGRYSPDLVISYSF